MKQGNIDPADFSRPWGAAATDRRVDFL